MARTSAAELWSPDHARGITTTAEAAKYADAAGRLVSDVQSRDGQATVAVALATWSAYHVGLIADGRTADAKGVETGGEYARRIHKPQSMVSRLRKVGHVLVVCGLPTDPKGTVPLADGKPFPMFQVLASKGGADKIGDDIYGMSSVDEVRDALLKHYGPDGKRLTTPPTGGKGKPRQGLVETESGDLTVTRTDKEGNTETETVDPSRFAVRLAQMLVEHVQRHEADIKASDRSVIAGYLGRIGFVTTPVPVKRTASKRTAKAPAKAPAKRTA